jgi:hypothetical protein
VSYILARLDEDYNDVDSTVVTRVEPITPSELYAQLLGYEQHLQLQNGGTSHYTSSANSASRDRGMSRGRSGGLSRGRSEQFVKYSYQKLANPNDLLHTVHGMTAKQQRADTADNTLSTS